MLERDAPLPTAAVGRRSREGIRIALIGARSRDRAVAWEPVAPLFISGLKGLLDQQTSETGAIDEKVSLDSLAAVQRYRFDKAVFGSQPRVDDLALDALDACVFSIASKVCGVEASVEVKGVFEIGQGD